MGRAGFPACRFGRLSSRPFFETPGWKARSTGRQECLPYTQKLFRNQPVEYRVLGDVEWNIDETARAAGIIGPVRTDALVQGVRLRLEFVSRQPCELQRRI